MTPEDWDKLAGSVVTAWKDYSSARSNPYGADLKRLELDYEHELNEVGDRLDALLTSFLTPELIASFIRLHHYASNYRDHTAQDAQEFPILTRASWFVGRVEAELTKAMGGEVKRLHTLVIFWEAARGRDYRTKAEETRNEEEAERFRVAISEAREKRQKRQ